MDKEDVCVYIRVYIYIYTHIYIYRERENVSQWNITQPYDNIDAPGGY